MLNNILYFSHITGKLGFRNALELFILISLNTWLDQLI